MTTIRVYKTIRDRLSAIAREVVTAAEATPRPWPALRNARSGPSTCHVRAASR
ncbi:hypothetical protein [Nonomuraea sp. PA05]|uniref:hypothetical protein n=1 Tax=Nonomuraea sp. PA05 TaxID=2604466 RepID=UPI0016527CEB|nr:hypothetical protein [Nonomuraea sp. PA05]